VRKKLKPRPKSITTDDFIAVFECTTGNRLIDWRNRTILALFADTGARLGGIAGMSVDDVNLIQRRGRVVEKGSHVRMIFWTHYTNRLLLMWLARRPKIEHPALFVSIREGRPAEPLTRSGIRQIMKRLKKQAGVRGRVNPHAFRHKFAQEYLKSGGDVITLMHLGGWQDVQTVKDYYAVFDEQELADLQAQHSPLLKMLGEEQ